MNKKKILLLGGGATLLLIIIAILLAGSAFKTIPVKQELRIYIPSGSSYSQVLDTLDAHNLLISPTAFHLMANLRKYPDHVKSGSYLVEQNMSQYALFNKLYRGQQDAIKLTLGKYRTKQQLCQYLDQKLECSADSILFLLEDAAYCKNFDETPQSIIGIFIPNTYQIYWNVSPKRLIERIYHESQQFWNQRQDKLRSLGYSQQEVIALASIVEEETNYNPEKSTIASVYLNRLKIGMPLQADPTVKYALGDFAIRRIINAMLTYDSPYNTYRYKGIPPGPICTPSISSIDAVLENKKTDFIFFCAKEDFSGKHNFASNAAEHARNAAKFHNALNNRKIYK